MTRVFRAAQRIGAALGGDGLSHELRGRLGRCRLTHSHSEQQRSSKRRDVFHELLPLLDGLLSPCGPAVPYLATA